ncbi:diguanylate cyclase [Xanthomonas sp. NCPPB 2632]|uniref:tetratricopeptide repeat-containing diguanylate cyclase n=1 Tax=Xanthomonas sp. NCPPB 2632 TaxID=3240912 RepID=UPI0035176DA5
MTPRRAFATLAWMGCSLFMAGSAATPAVDTIDARLTQAEAIRTKDHPRFLAMLDELRRDGTHLNAAQSWHLRYMDAWERMFEGHYPESEAVFRDVIARSGDPALRAKATALLMDNLVLQGRYTDAYVQANEATDLLPGTTDPLARFTLLSHLSQTLNFAGQHDLALKYAQLMVPATPAGETPCPARYMKVAALEGLRQLTSHSDELTGAIDECTTDGQPVFANALSLILVDRYLDEHEPARAMALLDRIEPGIRASTYFPALVAVTKQRAQAYQQLGKPAKAREWASRAVAMSHPGDVNEWLRDAYQVLYQVEKDSGHADAALAYHEHYVAQDQGYRRDESARTLAYEAARQHVVAQRLQAASLLRENDILRLQREVDAKALETERLRIGLLALVVLGVTWGLVRLRRSQLRYKRLSAHDGLTDIFIRAHFIAELKRSLDTLKRRSVNGCFLALDLDHFKVVNDTHGHTVGDAALRHVVTVCKSQLRSTDLFGRLGGEEFGIFLPGTTRERGSAIAERIRLAIDASPLTSEGAIVLLSTSIGVACTDTIGYDPKRLSRAADDALYRAKREGRNRVVVEPERFTPPPPRNTPDT